MKLLHSEVLLTKRLSLFNNSKVQGLVANLIAATKMSPHVVRSSKTLERHGEINLKACKQDSFSTSFLTQPSLIEGKISLISLQRNLRLLKQSSFDSIIRIGRVHRGSWRSGAHWT